MSSRDIFVSSGGMGGSLNHFCRGILVLTRPVVTPTLIVL